jgi:diadenosine tetraphosphate (Ap4A) HIT family hydrolase
MSDCVFCSLIAGEGEMSVVYEDEHLVGFMDLYPVTPGHVLLVPREHAASMSDLDEDTGAHVFRVALRMQQAVRRSGVRCEGVNLIVADGAAAGQDVFHFHLHVIPRFDGDPFQISADWKEAPRAELDRTAEQIRAAYEERWPA